MSRYEYSTETWVLNKMHSVSQIMVGRQKTSIHNKIGDVFCDNFLDSVKEVNARSTVFLRWAHKFVLLRFKKIYVNTFVFGFIFF